jgi:hypothetical protein
MFVVRDKSTQAVLHIAPSAPGERRKPEEVFPDFDAETMEFGRTDEPWIPAAFAIVRGVVRPLDEPEPAAAEEEAAPPPLAEVKTQLLSHYSELSLERRRELIPAHKLENAALGVYDEEQTRAIRETMEAFRNEYHRLEEAISAAKSLEDLGRLRPRFPRSIAARGAAAARAPEPEADEPAPAPRKRGRTK